MQMLLEHTQQSICHILANYGLNIQSNWIDSDYVECSAVFMTVLIQFICHENFGVNCNCRKQIVGTQRTYLDEEPL